MTSADSQHMPPWRVKVCPDAIRQAPRPRRMAIMASLACLLALPGTGPASAAAPESRATPPPQLAGDPATLCDVAITAAARETGAPPDLLRALALAESGRARGGDLRPWPWTVNMAGQGYWFDTRAAAEAFVERAHANGTRSFDIGCLQINHRWHRAAFASPAQMFEPTRNAAYAARFLVRLRSEFGSWEAAAGAYHSRSPDLAERYLARVRAHLAEPLGEQRIAGGTTQPQAVDTSPSTRHAGAPAPPPPARRPYPLLHPAGESTLGSLVPVARVRAPVPLVPLQRDM